MQNIVVKKFGGTSLGSLERIERVASRLKEDYDKGQRPVVVASAMSGETNRLVSLAQKIGSESKGLAYDMLLASGEQVSIALLSLALQKRGLKASPLLAHQAGIHTNASFSKARIQEIKPDRIKEILKSGAIPLIAGFQGVTPKGSITTLGRGGSDLTALALAASLKTDFCEIYTDVLGVFTADPRLVKEARKINYVGFSEMMEMASLGSQVLHFRSVELGARYGVKIHVRHARKQEEGTWIIKKEDKMENSVVSAVAHDLNTLVIQINKPPRLDKFTCSLFNKLGEKDIFVDIISQVEIGDLRSLAFSIQNMDLASTKQVLKDVGVSEDQFSILTNVAKISIVGVGMATHSGVAGDFFSVLSRLKIPLHLVTTSEIKISAIIDKKHITKAAKELHKVFCIKGR